MASGRFITKEEVTLTKMLLKKKVGVSDIANILRRSATSIKAIERGEYDYLIDEGDSEDDVQPAFNTDSIVHAVDDNTKRLEEPLSTLAETLKKMEGQLEQLTTAVMYLAKCEENRQAKYEASKKRLQEPAELLKWPEILRRIKKFGDPLTYTYLKDASARWDGQILLIDCSQPVRDYLSRNASAVEKITQQAKLVLSTPVEVKW